MCLANMQNSKYLGLTVSQIQGDMGLVNMSDLKNLDLVVSEVQLKRDSQPAKLKETWVWLENLDFVVNKV